MSDGFDPSKARVARPDEWCMGVSTNGEEFAIGVAPSGEHRSLRIPFAELERLLVHRRAVLSGAGQRN